MSATDHTLTDAETEWFREECAVCLGDGCRKCEAVRDEVDRLFAARLATAEAEKEALRASKSALVEKVKRLQDQIARASMEPGQDRQKAMHAYAGRAEAAETALAGLVAGLSELATQANDEAQTHWYRHNEASDDGDLDRANREGEVAEAFDQTRSALRALIDTDHAAALRAREAKAWDEGEAAGRDNADDGYPDPMVENPYRADSIEQAHP